jgi:phosphatidylserine/phosphatidylglycerophosphate/cardiolipin synthase-like enzyme
VKTYASQAIAAVDSYAEQYMMKRKLKKSNYWETRDLYPRMAWHDCQVGVSGSIARDLTSHFIQVRF